MLCEVLYYGIRWCAGQREGISIIAIRKHSAYYVGFDAHIQRDTNDELSLQVRKCTCPQLYQFPVAAITNFHRFSGLKQHRFILLGFRWSEVLKPRRGEGCVPSEDRGRVCFLALSSSWGQPMSSVCPSSIFKPAGWHLQTSLFLTLSNLCFYCHISDSELPASLLKRSLWLHWTFQSNPG